MHDQNTPPKLFVKGGPPRYRHQEQALARMIEKRGVCAILYDPGLGKTASVIDFACLLALKAGRETRVLVVAPLAAVDTWVTQMEIFASPQVAWWAEALGGSIIQRGEALAARGGAPLRSGTPGTPRKKAPKPRKSASGEPGSARALHYQRSVYLKTSPEIDPALGPESLGPTRLVLAITSISTFSSRAPRGSQTMADYVLEAVRRFNPDLVVVDESHSALKAPSGNSSRLLARIGATVPRRVIMTGSVFPHSPLDAFGQWRFLDPTAFSRGGKPMPYATFKATFSVPGGFMGHQIKSFKNLDAMQDVMARNSIVARKADALDLPPVTDVRVPVDLSPAEAKAYKQMKDDLCAQLHDGSLAIAPNALSRLMRLRQLTSGFLPGEDGQISVLGRSKVATITSIAQDQLAGESRVVIFSLFRQEIAALAEALTGKGTLVQVITGDTPPSARMQMRQLFGSADPQRIVMVAQISTMSLAVNELVTASHAIFGSLSQRRDDWVQARARLDRSGQVRPVTFWTAAVPRSVDEVILRAYQSREDLETAMLDYLTGE